jgi:hypothetical protein
VLGGEQRDHAAGTGQAEALDDEVVVHPVPAGVVPRIMQRDVGERHVPDGQVEQVSRQAGVGEALGTHLRLRIQGLRDRGRCLPQPLSAPPAPPGQHLLLIRSGGCPLFSLHQAQRAQGVQVRGEPSPRT